MAHEHVDEHEHGDRARVRSREGERWFEHGGPRTCPRARMSRRHGRPSTSTRRVNEHATGEQGGSGWCHPGAGSALDGRPFPVKRGHRPVNQGPGPCLPAARSVAGMHPSHGRRSRSTWRDASLPWEKVTKHAEAVTDARASVHPSHGRRSRMRVHGCTSPIGGRSRSRWRDALLTHEGVAMRAR
jgi:hypothetical protein